MLGRERTPQAQLALPGIGSEGVRMDRHGLKE
jgi:hypothetical protein